MISMTSQMPTWDVTEQKIDEVVRRIIAVADPLQIILFGSRARGDFREDSDVDVAVVLDAPEEEVRTVLPGNVLRGIKMEVTLIAVSKAKFDLHKPWLNSIYNYIDREGVVLYDRDDKECARQDALRTGTRRRDRVAVSAA